MDDNSNKLEKPIICQSCGSTVYFEEDLGMMEDGSYSNDYCRLCLDFGEFTDKNTTYSEHVENIARFLMDTEKLSEQEAMQQAEDSVKDLKKWQQLKAMESN